MESRLVEVKRNDKIDRNIDVDSSESHDLHNVSSLKKKVSSLMKKKVIITPEVQLISDSSLFTDTGEAPVDQETKMIKTILGFLLKIEFIL